MSVICIRPGAAAPTPMDQLKLLFSCSVPVVHGGKQLGHHQLRAELPVACSDLSHGLPDPNQCLQFNLPCKDETQDGMSVMVGIVANHGDDDVNSHDDDFDYSDSELGYMAEQSYRTRHPNDF